MKTKIFLVLAIGALGAVGATTVIMFTDPTTAHASALFCPAGRLHASQGSGDVVVCRPNQGEDGFICRG